MSAGSHSSSVMHRMLWKCYITQPQCLTLLLQSAGADIMRHAGRIEYVYGSEVLRPTKKEI